MTPTSSLVLHTDGGALGNPGPASIGWLLMRGRSIYAYAYGAVGTDTNNAAEYRALIHGLRYLRDTALPALGKDLPVTIRTDSKLVRDQITGEFRVREPALATLRHEAVSLLAGITYTIEWCPRLSNQSADQLVNIAHRDRSDYTIVEPWTSNRLNPLADQLKHKHFHSFPGG